MIEGIDHVVLTVRDVERAAAFFARVLGMQVLTFGDNRTALQAGRQKVNLQVVGQESRNHACIGSGDLCLETSLPPGEVIDRLTREGVAIHEGPVGRTGARGPITSVYFNDPDGNLIEVSSYAKTAS